MRINGILKKSNEGLMSGNGTLGILLFGENELCVSLDRINLWDKRIPKVCSDLNFNYQHLVESLNSDYQEAYRLFDECYNYPFSTKINAGIVRTGIKTCSTDYGEISYFNGVVEYYAKDNSLKAYVDANVNVIVLEFKKDNEIKINLPDYFYKSLEENGLGYKEPTIFKKDGFNIILQPMYDEELFCIVSYQKGKKYYITVITNDHLDLAKQTILNYIDNEKQNLEKHENSLTRYFAKSNIVTPDDSINQEFNLGRYYFYANSRKKYPCSLQGVWTDYTEKLPPWKNDFHNDINLQITYEPYLKLGNYSEGKVLLDYLERLLPKFKRNAKCFMKTDGIYIPGVMNIEGHPLGGWPQYAFNPVCQIWLIKVFDDYYRYLEDNHYLKTVVFPIFKEVEKSIFQILTINEEGKYEMGFHSSPEYFEDDKKSVFKDQTNFEITMLKYLYTTLLDYCTILNQDSRHFTYVFERLSDYYRNENGELMISKNQEIDMSHRHFSHMLMYSNMKLVDPCVYKDLIKKDLNKLESLGTSKWVGFSYVQDADIHAYIGEGEEAYKALHTYVEAFVHPNGFHMNNDYKGIGYSDMDCYVFTLEANFSFVTTLEDMMLRNFYKKITIFPAIPDSFKKSKTTFTNLRTYGNHQVSAEIKNYQISFNIKMSKEDELEIYNNFKDNPVFIVDGSEMKFMSFKGQFIKVHAFKTIEYKN